jgi:hypothetical protein
VARLAIVPGHAGRRDASLEQLARLLPPFIEIVGPGNA